MIRTRFAPSPTGFMHIGNLRTALFAFLTAKRAGGQFILRLEDTDRNRYFPEAIQVIYDSLHIAGIDYDEGPEKDGGYGPYVQSERLPIYRQYIFELLERGGAYPCFCKPKPADADSNPEEHPEHKPLDPCRTLSETDANVRIIAGEPYVVRQKVPREGSTSFHDHVFGDITFPNEVLDDQVLLKSDGFPTYNFANVVDDHLMEITHVIRGVEYLSSTPKYNMLYQSFGWDIPQYVHLPHIVKESGGKLSKRENDASFNDLLARGYLPEAIVNYIALLGWNPGDDRERFSLPELIAEFSIDRISKSNAIFSLEKLNWLSGLHIRALTDEDLNAAAQPYYPPSIKNTFDTLPITRLLKPRLVRLMDIPPQIDFLVQLPEYGPDLFVHKKSKSSLESSLAVLNQVTPLLDQTPWTSEALFEALVQFAAQIDLHKNAVLWALRIALSGCLVTPGGATEIAAILGKEESLRRIQIAIGMLTAAAPG